MLGCPARPVHGALPTLGLCLSRGAEGVLAF